MVENLDRIERTSIVDQTGAKHFAIVSDPELIFEDAVARRPKPAIEQPLGRRFEDLGENSQLSLKGGE